MESSLSRRIGRISLTNTILKMDIEDYVEFVTAASKAGVFDKLEGRFQNLILAAEGETK